MLKKKSVLGINLYSEVDELTFGSRMYKMKIQNPHFKNFQCTSCTCDRNTDNTVLSFERFSLKYPEIRFCLKLSCHSKLASKGPSHSTPNRYLQPD